MTALPPISSEHARALLRSAIDADPGAAVQQRVLERFEHSLMLPSLPPAQAPSVPHGLSALSPKLLVGVALTAGVGIGIGVDRLATSKAHSSAPIVATAGPAQLPPAASLAESGSPAVDVLPSVSAEELPLLRSATPKRAASAPTPEPVDSTRVSESPRASLREQQALLDQARLALGQGQPSRCLEALATHRRRFPSSLLAEERDALTIKALAAAGNLDAARRQASAFVANYPRSLLLPSIETTVGTNR